MNSCMSNAALEPFAWIELNFERGTPSAVRDLSNRDSGMDPQTPTVKFACPISQPRGPSIFRRSWRSGMYRDVL